jgi:hypothetical protein
MNYDDWKLGNPFDEEGEDECSVCGTAIGEGETYCSKDCFKADQL